MSAPSTLEKEAEGAECWQRVKPITVIMLCFLGSNWYRKEPTIMLGRFIKWGWCYNCNIELRNTKKPQLRGLVNPHLWCEKGYENLVGL
jgi:hypothetical protein